MKIFKSLKNCLYEYTDRLPLKMAQVDSKDGKLRICATNGTCLSSYTFKKIKNDKFYYISAKDLAKISECDSFKFKCGKINDVKLIADGNAVRVCDNLITIGSFSNKEANERFPLVDSVIPKEFKNKFIVSRKSLCKAIKDEEYVTLKFNGNKLFVISSKYKTRAHKVTLGKQKALISMECLGEQIKESITLNAKILKAILCIPYDDICLCFNSVVSPLGVFYEDENISVNNLIMPLFIKG